jgi:outer membrane immunogenic protein
MKSALRFIAGGLFLLSPLAVAAADLGMNVAPAPLSAAPVVYNWTGAYVGLNGGWAGGQQDPIDLLSSRFDRTSFSTSGGMVGGTVGLQIQQGPVFIGVEGDIDWANIRGSGTVIPAIAGIPAPITLNMATNIDALATGRMRFGMALNNWLFYGTAGGAFLRGTANGSSVAGVACGTAGVLVSCSTSQWRPGLAVGLGTEYGFTQNWSVKVEYLYVTALGTGLSTDQINLVRGGVNYKF